MKVFQVLSQALVLSVLITLVAHGQEEDRPPRPSAEMRAEFEKKTSNLKEAAHHKQRCEEMEDKNAQL